MLANHGHTGKRRGDNEQLIEITTTTRNILDFDAALGLGEKSGGGE
jgi:hypothetical protein